MEHPDSPPRLRQKRRLELLQYEQNKEVATNMYHLGEDQLNLSIAFLGVGHFRYQNIACKMFLKASEQQPDFKKITTSESVCSSIKCVQKYFEDEGTGKEQLLFFWYSVVRHDRVGIMRWADERLYTTSVDDEGDTFILNMDMGICSHAAKFGHLPVLQ